MPSVLKSGQILLRKSFASRAQVEVGGITDARLARVQLLVVRRLVRFAGRHVADLLEAERDGVVCPDVDGMTQDRVNRLGHVKIADAAAGDTRTRRRPEPVLSSTIDVGARTGAAAFELHRQMPRCRQAVNACADDDSAGRMRELPCP